VAAPLRFRRSTDNWTAGRVRSDLLADLDDTIGATMRSPWLKQPAGYEARRFEMDNGDVALFAWRDGEAYWLGNTETPSALWRTDKYTFEEVPDAIAEWAKRELLAQLHEEDPWLADYPNISEFFLPVFLSKDGRHTTRAFFRDHAAGFPETDREDALEFYEAFLATGAFEDPYEMAAKLGTSPHLELDRMRSAMSEFTVAKLLQDTGYEITSEIEVTSGHAIDFRATRGDGGTLVEVTRPSPPDTRNASSAVAAVKETARTKTSGQLETHGGGVTLFVDCSSLTADQWAEVREARPDVHHRPAVVFWLRPDGRLEGYTKGSVPIDTPSEIDT